MEKYAQYSSLSPSEVLDKLNSGRGGLDSGEVQKRLGEYGANILKADSVKWWQILLRQFKSPFIYLLIAAFVISLLFRELIEGIMIMAFLLINMTLGFVQEYRSEHTVKLLRKYFLPSSRVMRNGKEGEVETTLLVPGDLVILSPGDIVPADMRLLESTNVVIDESVLTGESVPVDKESGRAKDLKNICYSGTVVVSGEGLGVVLATGVSSEIGKIAKLASSVSRESTFEKQIARFSRFTLFLVIITLLGLMTANLIIKKDINFIELTIFSLALAVSVVPEALPVVITFSLSKGAHKLAKKNVVVKRLSAIEDLGSIEVLCSDKTGTLTENKLAVSDYKGSDKDKIKLYATLALHERGESMNVNSFKQAMESALTPTEHELFEKYELKEELPFDPKRKRTSRIVGNRGIYELVSIGSPEDVIPICSKQDPKILSWASEMGKEGKRVLAVASKKVEGTKHEDLQKLEKNLNFIGLVAFSDPIKQSTYLAIDQAKALGVQVKILTGDSREVAGHVAKEIGLTTSPTDVISGSEFEELSVQKQHEAVNTYHVFARVTPELKHKIVSLLEEKYEVGFLGEGINDAAALKIANVALVVQGGADIAKDSSDIVLLQRSLKVIIDGIEEGRQVFANTTKYVSATLSANFGNFFAIALASLIINYLPMLPLQILLVNLLSDFPMIAVSTDRVDKDLVQRPSKYDLKSLALMALTLGIVSTVFDFIFFGVFVAMSPQVLHTAWFMGSILTELVFIYSIRSRRFFLHAVRPSAPLVILSILAGGVTIVLPFTAVGRNIFRFTSLANIQVLAVLGIVGAYFLATETVKILYYRFAAPK